MLRIVLIVLSILCALLVLAGFDTGDLGDIKVLALSVLFCAVAVVAP